MAAVCEVWGADRVGVRISPLNQYNDMRDSNPQALFNNVGDALRPFGLAYLHVMERDVHGSELPLDFPELRRRFNRHYMANGGYDKRRANAAIAAESSVLYRIPRVVFIRILEGEPQAATALRRLVGARVARVVQDLDLVRPLFEDSEETHGQGAR